MLKRFKSVMLWSFHIEGNRSKRQWPRPRRLDKARVQPTFTTIGTTRWSKCGSMGKHIEDVLISISHQRSSVRPERAFLCVASHSPPTSKDAPDPFPVLYGGCSADVCRVAHVSTFGAGEVYWGAAALGDLVGSIIYGGLSGVGDHPRGIAIAGPPG